MGQLALLILGIFFPPIWFCMGGKAIADAHQNETKKNKNKNRKAQKRARSNTALARSLRVNRELEEKIKQKNNQIWQLKKINKAQQPMANDGVNKGTYELYRSGFKRIIHITFKRQRLSTYTMPEIRAVCDEMLGASKPTQFHGWTRTGKPRTRAPR